MYFYNSNYCLESLYVDLNGRPVERTKMDHPYSYDPFVVWCGAFNEATSRCVYSDRLFQWNSNKFNECCIKVFTNKGQYFYDRTPEDIERFLSEYLGESVKLTAVMEGCNASSGYPFWVFYYESK